MLPEFSPLAPSFGVEMPAIDVKQLTTADIGHLNRLLSECLLLVFRGQPLSFEDQVALTAVFGEVDEQVLPGDRPFRHQDDPRIQVVSNRRDTPTLTTASTFWHTDQSFRPLPSPVIVLSARILPSEGGGATMFADMRAAYEALPASRQATLDGLHARHRFGAAFGIAALTTAPGGGAVHPLVRAQPQTNRRMLYLNQFCMDSIEGLSECEGRELLHELYDHCLKDQFVYSHSWRPGDVLVWDNLALMHRLADVPTELRVLHRTNTKASLDESASRPAVSDPPRVGTR